MYDEGMSPRRTRSRDLNELAHQLVAEATGDAPTEQIPPEDDGKDPAAVELGRKGGRKGGKARAAKMTEAQRSEAAQKAAQARWTKLHS